MTSLASLADTAGEISFVSEDVRIGETAVAPGTAAFLELPVARLFTGNWLSLPVAVVHGAAPGPRLWLSAALHGDELNGMEIIRLVLQRIEPLELRDLLVLMASGTGGKELAVQLGVWSPLMALSTAVAGIVVLTVFRDWLDIRLEE